MTDLDPDKIARIVAVKFRKRCPWLSEDDLYQEAMLGIIQAMHKGHDPSKGSKQAYYFGAAKNKASDFICKFRLPIGGYFKIIDKLEEISTVQADLVSLKKGGELSPEEMLLRKELILDVRARIKKILSLNDEQTEILIGFLCKESKVSDIDDQKERYRIYNLKKSIKKKFRNSAQLRKHYEV